MYNTNGQNREVFSCVFLTLPSEQKKANSFIHLREKLIGAKGHMGQAIESSHFVAHIIQSVNKIALMW